MCFLGAPVVRLGCFPVIALLVTIEVPADGHKSDFACSGGLERSSRALCVSAGGPGVIDQQDCVPGRLACYSPASDVRVTTLWDAQIGGEEVSVAFSGGSHDLSEHPLQGVIADATPCARHRGNRVKLLLPASIGKAVLVIG